jgi:hypothetical protein
MLQRGSQNQAASLTIGQQALRARARYPCCARARIRIGWVDATTLRPARIPPPSGSTQMNQDLSILQLVLNASVVVQL